MPVFRAAGISVTKIETEYAGHAGKLAQTVELLDAFVGIGGDGTAHEIANGMLRRPANERVPIGIVPAGSGNTWAFDLGLDDAEAAAQAIAAGETKCVDVMAVGPVDSSGAVEYAINICGWGMPAAVLEQANALRWLGSAQYELAGLVLIATGRTRYSATLEIECEGETLTRELDDASFVQAHINQHMGKKVPFAPGARVDDDLLDLVLVKSSKGLDILHANARARGATHVKLPYVELIRCKRVSLTPRIESADGDGGGGGINLDGELLGGGAFAAECVPRALEVYASRLRDEPLDTSAELEPRLVMSLVELVNAATNGNAAGLG